MRKTTTEMEIRIPNGRIFSALVMPDGSCKLLIENYNKEVIKSEKLHNLVKNFDPSIPETEECIKEIFTLIEASKLSINDDFMQYEPKNKKEQDFKNLLIEAINSGVKDFYSPVCDPSITMTGEEIFYELGRAPIVGHNSIEWWEKQAKKYHPKRNSRLGTKNEYVAFYGVLIKKLVKEGLPIEEAWSKVCELGHYCTSTSSMDDINLTESKKICDFYNLINTSKILYKDEKKHEFFIALGPCISNICRYQLTEIQENECENRDCLMYRSIGWIVLEK